MFRFEKDDNGVQVIMYINNDDSTWMEVTDHFIEFMLGCGYLFDHQELADYIKEEYENIMMYRRNADADKD